IDTFKVTNVGGNNIYYREFKKGYVYVNPTRNNVLNIPLPKTCKQLTHTNFKNDPTAISNTTTINLVSHRGTFLLKSDGKVNLEDFAVLAAWRDDGGVCSTPDWCGGSDFDMSRTVDMFDLAYFAQN
ncbi:MAG: hypothetical protein KAT56_06275, partial [Sedimentisphaerales bacterium]|nr:hypothetical protein [Sedimentisphaerales bacterium]